MSRKHIVTIVEHTDGTQIVAWYKDDGLQTVSHCLNRGEKVKVYTDKMTEAEFNALEDYDGEC